jgi:hypothetical protein
MPTPAETGLHRWHALVESRDPGGLPAMIAEDAVFHSPAVHSPQPGRALVTAYLTGAIHVLGPTLHYVEEWQNETTAALRFTAEVDGQQVVGVDLITWDDEGLIADFTVMLRPFKALEAVMGRMLEQLTS